LCSSALDDTCGRSASLTSAYADCAQNTVVESCISVGANTTICSEVSNLTLFSNLFACVDCLEP